MEDLRKKLEDELNKIIDPELGLGLIDAGIVRKIDIEGGKVKVEIMPTAPFCPLVTFFVEEIKRRLKNLEGVEEVEVKLSEII